MKMLIRAALGLSVFLACAPAFAQDGMQVTAPAGIVPSLAMCLEGADGKAVCPQSLPVAQGPLAAATTSPLEGTVTSSAATPTSGVATLNGGTAYIGPLVPQLGRDIRVILKGTWAGTVQIGTAAAASGCAPATINPLTVAGQSWGQYTANANEVVDTPTLGASPSGTAAPVYCATATITSGTLTYAVRQ